MNLSSKEVSILILLDYLFLLTTHNFSDIDNIKVSILILLDYLFLSLVLKIAVTAIMVSILILLDYLFLLGGPNDSTVYSFVGLNPYFIGLPILMDQQRYTSETNVWSLNPYFIGLPILINTIKTQTMTSGHVSILILLDYLFLLGAAFSLLKLLTMSQSLFYWITYSYFLLLYEIVLTDASSQSLFYWITYSYNDFFVKDYISDRSQSLFYWITYSYCMKNLELLIIWQKSQSLFYWITYSYSWHTSILVNSL